MDTNLPHALANRSNRLPVVGLIPTLYLMQTLEFAIDDLGCGFPVRVQCPDSLKWNGTRCVAH
jgi:hypothetical protein